MKRAVEKERERNTLFTENAPCRRRFSNLNIPPRRKTLRWSRWPNLKHKISRNHHTALLLSFLVGVTRQWNDWRFPTETLPENRRFTYRRLVVELFFSGCAGWNCRSLSPLPRWIIPGIPTGHSIGTGSMKTVFLLIAWCGASSCTSYF